MPRSDGELQQKKWRFFNTLLNPKVVYNMLYYVVLYIYILVPGKSGRKMGPRKETVAIPRNYGRVLLATAQFWHVLATHLEETMFTNNFYII